MSRWGRARRRRATCAGRSWPRKEPCDAQRNHGVNGKRARGCRSFFSCGVCCGLDSPLRCADVQFPFFYCLQPARLCHSVRYCPRSPSLVGCATTELYRNKNKERSRPAATATTQRPRLVWPFCFFVSTASLTKIHERGQKQGQRLFFGRPLFLSRSQKIAPDRQRRPAVLFLLSPGFLERSVAFHLHFFFFLLTFFALFQ
ncbi:hypothetical protein TW95_gp1322 [Pandoravirus inopinatum]|uniref:Uncharacterized protein n=1 Tax=Pandoravirus inopinatum TaxID=1605721 RepID=A0A0B5JAQ6_9VIRU|nr:hypothetical protein TW95_gp1322 [Pandoravirus inopinatum]AJF98056.1 hypothetical protein [Pandoravirus inopinatum]